jgi:hypothetical protein
MRPTLLGIKSRFFRDSQTPPEPPGRQPGGSKD